tara:strand:- start:299 stop:784 length:486 start_codon:yes stop_codon:yes gene_type:complete
MNIKNIFSIKNLYCLFLVLIIFILDRITKLKIIEKYSDHVEYINDFLNIDLIWNTGIGFGILSLNAGIFYNIISLIILIVIFLLIYLILTSNKLDSIFFSILLGGATGNLYDRFTYFAVPDFIDLHFNDYHWFTFNVADIFITIGIILLIFKDIFFKNKNL